MKLKGIDGVHTSDEACGLIECKTNNLTRAWHVVNPFKKKGAIGNANTGDAQLFSTHAIRCLVKSHNERNPCV